MAQFRATIKGSRGATSRLGGKLNGISARIDGWEYGIAVECYFDEKKAKDVFFVYKTGGSRGARGPIEIAKVEGI